jgi:hypothetical protein
MNTVCFVARDSKTALRDGGWHFGLPRQAQRDPAFAPATFSRNIKWFRPIESAVVAALCRRSPRWTLAVLSLACCAFLSLPACAVEKATTPFDETQFTRLLDAPLLFVKRHSYTNMHIYDTYYKWPPGGGGIYLLENPSAPRSEWRIRAVIDPETSETRGFGVYSHPELSWDARRVLFCFKGQPQGNTSIFEIGVDGKNLRRLSDPGPTCVDYKGNHNGQHDTAPAYLADGRIVFLSTRQSGLVPCNNTGVGVLHVMNADGTDLHPISVNFVNEFDPAVLPDGRILYGRWEYVDKNALTIQSLWTCNPDGAQETALYANNMVFPEALLDARPVPGSPLLVATLAKHNGPPRGSIAFLDPRIGKNDPKALFNLEHPKEPTRDTGNSCEPWALNEDVVVFSGRPPGAKRNAIKMIDRIGNCLTLIEDSDICLHSPMLVKPRMIPPVIPVATDRKATTGRLLVQDVYQGLGGVKRGDVKWLRVIEETSRVSPSTMGGSPYNQTFLVSAALAFSAKNYLGLVPVTEEGSAYFEVPSGRALYLQALDGDHRLVQSMRTFIQAAPGTTRSCVGCHENKSLGPGTLTSDAGTVGSSNGSFPLTPALSLGERGTRTPLPEESKRAASSRGHDPSQEPRTALPLPKGEGRDEGGHSARLATSTSSFAMLQRPPAQLQPESWGGGHLDYPSMVQPILNRHCVSCHGGAKGIDAGLDLTGGWTEHFSISYENLVNRRERQLEATLIAGIDCMNGTAHWSCQIFPPRAHGSGAAPLAQLLMKDHGGVKLTRAERDLIMAWIDSNGLYHGTWDSTTNGCATKGWKTTRDALIGEMQKNTCACCHGDEKGKVARFEEDWINLEQPELSRLLRAPLPEGADGFGLGLCRSREVDPKQQRIRQLVDGYAHSVKPVEAFARRTFNAPDRSGTAVVGFPSTKSEDYQSLLAIIRRGRQLALAEPRVDMPGAKIVPGESRQLIALALPDRLPVLRATATANGVLLSWDRRSDIAGLTFELHRSDKAGFTPGETTRLVSLTRFDYLDAAAPPGEQHYALRLIADGRGSPPVRADVAVDKAIQSAGIRPAGRRAGGKEP